MSRSHSVSARVPKSAMIGCRKRRFDEAVPKLRLALQEDWNYLQTFRSLAACHAHMGRLSDAREVARLGVISINDATFLRSAAHREVCLSGLRLAAGEAE
jgi:adenylate cyclase